MFEEWKEDMIYQITYKPEIRYYRGTNIIHSINFKRNGKFHNIDFHAVICYYKNGNIKCKQYWLDGKLHRFDGPAWVEYHENGNIKCEQYYIDDELHRSPASGPANIEYYKNSSIGNEEYYLKNKLCREDGSIISNYDIEYEEY